MTDDFDITVTVNGAERSGRAAARRTLADYLRDDLELTGTHIGCEQGACGACTVLVDGAPVLSCLMLAVQANGAEVTTIEGLSTNGTMHPVQEAFKESYGFQCGFCTPGIVMTTLALLQEQADPDEAEIREHLSGNLCRCTGYQSIVDGVRLAAGKLANGERA